MQQTIELSHSFWNKDRDQEIQIKVNYNPEDGIQSVESLDVWKWEEDRQLAQGTSIDLALAEEAGIIDPMLESVDWHQLYAEHIADEAEYNALSRLDQ